MRLGKQLWLKISRRASMGPPLARFHPPSFWSIMKPGSLALCLTPISCVATSLCNPQGCWHLGSTSFSLRAKGTMSLGRLLCASCFQHYIKDFPKGLCYQYNYSHFRKDITAAESLPVCSDIPHVNYTFNSGIHLSIYLRPFTLLSMNTLLKTYFKAHFKSSWLKSMPIWFFE